MIICGDFCYPFESVKRIEYKCSDSFLFSPKVVNFESSLMYCNDLKSSVAIPLHSSIASIGFLGELNFGCLTLANNHTFDFNVDFKIMKSHLNPNFITVGAGTDLDKAEKPVKFSGYSIFNFGWQTIGVKAAKKNKPGCATLKRQRVLNLIKDYVKRYPDEKVVLILHWNYEFELYPLPIDREFARELSNIGVYAVIGHHSHIIQDYEYFGDMPVFYGIGNFFMPRHKFGNYLLAYPESANTGVCVDISDRKNIKLYLSKNNNNKLEIEGPFHLTELPDFFQNNFAGMSKDRYFKFFKKNREKSFLLPIYNKLGFQEVVFDFFVNLRQILIDFLVKFRMKK